MAISFALVAAGGVFSGIRKTFAPESGPASLLYGFKAVVVVGLGSLRGTFAGAIILGVAQGISEKIDVGVGGLARHLVFLAALFFKPFGLVPTTA